jgi:lactate dehydrogenase-like 2-hydroxyacid dehydrogenase
VQPVDVLLTAPIMPLVVEQLEAKFRLHKGWEAPDFLAWLAEVGPQIRGVAAASSRRMDTAVYDLLPRLEVVSSFGVGYDHVDAAEGGRRGVVVTNTPDVLTDEVADLTIGLLLSTLRHLPQADRYVRSGGWLQAPFPLTPTLRGRRVGILGLGRIGRAVARRLEGFGVAIAYHGRSQQADVPYEYHPTLVGLAEAVHVLVCVAPGGAETRNMVDAAVLRALGPEGVLINVGRGTVVDEPALIEALRSGTILSAGLDVFADEPRVPSELIDMPQVVLLPHVGSASVETRRAMGQLVVDNLVSWFDGKGPLTPVPETPWTAPAT